MAMPSEGLSRKCHSCEVDKPIDAFLLYVSGKKAGDRSIDCIRCLLKGRPQYRPMVCEDCGQYRGVMDYDRFAEDGRVCKGCIYEHIGKYTKQCTKCSQVKSTSEFHQQGRTKYFYPVCGRCDSAKTLARQSVLPKEARASMRRRHTDKLKLECYDAYGGRFCACCGEREMNFLTMDHIENDGADWRREHFGENNGKGGGINFYEWAKRNSYPPGFQVLCWNCQNGKRFNGGVCPHQEKIPCDGHPQVGVGSSEPKRISSLAEQDMTSACAKVQ